MNIKYIIKVFIIVGLAICILKSVNDKEWLEAIFWLLSFNTLVLIDNKNNRD